MIIFINLSNQIIEGEKNFAFLNTTNDKFISFAGTQIFESKRDFLDSTNSPALREKSFKDLVDRCEALIPNDFDV